MNLIDLAKLTFGDKFGSRPKLAITVLFTLIDLHDRNQLPIPFNDLSEEVAKVLNVKVLSVSSNIGKVLAALAQHQLVSLSILDENNTDRTNTGSGAKKVVNITETAKELFGRV